MQVTEDGRHMYKVEWWIVGIALLTEGDVLDMSGAQAEIFSCRAPPRVVRVEMAPGAWKVL